MKTDPQGILALAVDLPRPHRLAFVTILQQPRPIQWVTGRDSVTPLMGAGYGSKRSRSGRRPIESTDRFINSGGPARRPGRFRASGPHLRSKCAPACDEPAALARGGTRRVPGGFSSGIPQSGYVSVRLQLPYLAVPHRDQYLSGSLAEA